MLTIKKLRRKIPRRFGKSFAAQMLCAYYDCSCDSHALFDEKGIARTEGAVGQIKEKNYPAVIKDYGEEIVLAGINYDEKTGKHSCLIERV